jgi:hypothetical protein
MQALIYTMDALTGRTCKLGKVQKGEASRMTATSGSPSSKGGPADDTRQAAFLAKKKEKAAVRRAKPEDKGELGLTSLMDIVSIIVVYLLKSYASDPVIISPTAGQKIPLSTADSSMQDGIPIFVTHCAASPSATRRSSR